VHTCADGAEAIRCLAEEAFDAIVTDIQMPAMGGLDLLRAIRARDLDVPVILMTGAPDLEGVRTAIDHGALMYLVKPVDSKQFASTVERAVRLGKIARLKRAAIESHRSGENLLGDLASATASFDSALRSLWMAAQPIVSWSRRKVVAYELLVRTEEKALRNPLDLIHTAERLDRQRELSRTIRIASAEVIASRSDDTRFFVNLHPRDLEDDDLLTDQDPLTRHASRVVLEVTEREPLGGLRSLDETLLRLRERGYSIALDDLGAGYAGLSSFVRLSPEVVKIDMSLVRDVHRMPTAQRLVAGLVGLARDIGIELVAEGVETPEEREALVELGADLLQGYLLARPGRPFPECVLTR
jgi:EAL domain-containing protein (putative c-di-GMP-specific phosphodiesterase class I)